MKRKSKCVSYNKWGYIFVLPFILAYATFQIVPLFNTVYNSFFENYISNMKQVGPNFIGFENYASMLVGNATLWPSLGNTAIMWIMGFLPQILLSLLLGAWFSNARLRLKATGFFKTVIYLPNLIMASAFSMLFYSLFSDVGPVNSMLCNLGITTAAEPFRFFASVWASRSLVAFMNFVMWFGNTTILLMAGIMGIDMSLFEAAEVDGARPFQVFTRITLPLLKPILIYVVITSLIGGIQMFDVPQILTNGAGTPNMKTQSVIMLLNKHLFSKNYGMGGAISVILLIITAALSILVFQAQTKRDEA